MIMAKSVITDLIEKLSGVQPKQGKKRSIPHNLSIDRPSKVLFIEDQVPAVRISWNLLEYVKQSSEKNDNAISPSKRQGSDLHPSTPLANFVSEPVIIDINK